METDTLVGGVGDEGGLLDEGITSGKNKAIDYDKLDRDVAAQQELAKEEGMLKVALENMLNLEKQMRLAADVVATRKVVLAILHMCRDAGAWKLLNEYVVLLSKRRAQLKQAVASMVQEAMGFIDDTPDLATRVELIKTLSNVAAGKIYVEIERARLVKLLAKIKEDEGNVKEAADIMQEVAVETFGAMAKSEKVAFILEQVRLCLDNDDYMRAQILAKKISPRVFASESVAAAKAKAAAPADTGKTKKKSKQAAGEDGGFRAPADDVPDLSALKLKYYQLMIRYHAHSRDYLEVCRCYKNIYDTPRVRDDPSHWVQVLSKICWYVVLAPHGPMQSSLLHSTAQDKQLHDLPKLRALLKKFTTMEVVPWSQLAEEYRSEMEAETEVFGTPQATDDLRLRVIEHNILVVSKYYSRITMKRLAELLGLPADSTEKHLADMVVAKALHAKIDRPSGIVSFRANETGVEVLDSWAANIARLLDLVESSCHQIHKEAMVNKVVLKA